MGCMKNTGGFGGEHRVSWVVSMSLAENVEHSDLVLVPVEGRFDLVTCFLPCTWVKSQARFIILA